MAPAQGRRRRTALGAVAAGLLLATAACGGSSSNDSSARVTLTLWTNTTAGPGTDFFENTIASFEKADPNVTVTMHVVANEDLDARLQTALRAGRGTAPDVFLQRGGDRLQAMVGAGQVMDITDKISADATSSINDSSFGIEQVDGKTYAMPVDVVPGGFWYSKDLFAKAGITTPPTTVDELEADDAKLKSAGVAPIAVGGKDGWPAAHWYYWFALRECDQQTLDDTAKTLRLEDACWTRAGDDLQRFAATRPFDDGFLDTSAQRGAGSAAGLIAHHKAAMELMGAWDPGVIAGLTPDRRPLPDLGFFPMVSVPGGQGDPAATMGGGDGYSCSAWAPEPACTDFLNYLVTPDVQSAYATAFQTAPVNKTAQAAVTDPMIRAAIDSADRAPYVSLWLDTRYGHHVGDALDTAVADLLAGTGSVADIISTVNNAPAAG